MIVSQAKKRTPAGERERVDVNLEVDGEQSGRYGEDVRGSDKKREEWKR